MPYEYDFDANAWRDRFSFDAYWENSGYSGAQSITSPADLLFVEQARRRIARECDLGNPVPADLFVFALGEPEHRHATKVGGLPYRPRGLPWPKSNRRDDQLMVRGQWVDGPVPMTFLAQFCFLGSRDIVPDLPGDVMLVFAEDQCFSSSDSFHIEWYPAGLTDLIAVEEVPQPSWDFVRCYGYRHRTADYPELLDKLAQDDTYINMAITPAMKIGGLPRFVQNEFESWEHPEQWPGRFLCQLFAICPSFRLSWPWINREQSVDSHDLADNQELSLVDGGVIAFFLDEVGEVHCSFQCG
jgi:hypothetical protein